MILGGLIQGVTVVDGAFAGGPFDWATPFALACGVGLVFGYALLGATWLILRTDGAVQARARAPGEALLVARARRHRRRQPVDAADVDADRRALVLAAQHLLPVAGAAGHRGAGLAGLARAWTSERELTPFIGTVGLFVLAYLGLGISTFPLLVPPTLTVWDTAAVPDSQIFSLIGTMIMLPIILGYFVFMFWTFRAKVGAEGGYH